MAKTDLTKMTHGERVEALIKDNSLTSKFDRLNLWEEFDSDYRWGILLELKVNDMKNIKYTYIARKV